MSRDKRIGLNFFVDDELAECDPLARLLLIGLFSLADQEGILEDRPKKIKALILPYDDCDINALLNQLQEYNFISRDEIDDCKYIQVYDF
jgi:hypothetical protein